MEDGIYIARKGDKYRLVKVKNDRTGQPVFIVFGRIAATSEFKGAEFQKVELGNLWKERVDTSV